MFWASFLALPKNVRAAVSRSMFPSPTVQRNLHHKNCHFAIKCLYLLRRNSWLPLWECGSLEQCRLHCFMSFSSEL